MQIGNLQTNALASHGRGSDTMLAHMTPGEMTIPVEVQRANPELMEALRKAFLEMNANPDQYVVGSDANSINPETGLQEHGFGKVFKSIARYVLPVIGAAVAGPAGAAVGSAVGTKISGGTWGQAALSAVGSYAGSQILGPALGSAGIGTGNVGQTLNETVWSALPSEVSSSVAVQGIQNSLTDTAWSSVIGQQIGTMAADHVSGFSAAQAAAKNAKDAGMIGSAVSAPDLPSMPGASALPSPVAAAGPNVIGGQAFAPGVSMLQATKDRNTGGALYSFISPSGYDDGLGRRGAWGSLVTV